MLSEVRHEEVDEDEAESRAVKLVVVAEGGVIGLVGENAVFSEKDNLGEEGLENQVALPVLLDEVNEGVFFLSVDVGPVCVVQQNHQLQKGISVFDYFRVGFVPRPSEGLGICLLFSRLRGLNAESGEEEQFCTEQKEFEAELYIFWLLLKGSSGGNVLFVGILLLGIPEELRGEYWVSLKAGQQQFGQSPENRSVVEAGGGLCSNERFFEEKVNQFPDGLQISLQIIVREQGQEFLRKGFLQDTAGESGEGRGVGLRLTRR